MWRGGEAGGGALRMRGELRGDGADEGVHVVELALAAEQAAVERGGLGGLGGGGARGGVVARATSNGVDEVG